MTNPESDSARFEAISRELLSRGLTVRFEARGASMSPCIRDREIVHVTAVIVSKLRKGDIVLLNSNDGFRVHRLVVADPSKDLFVTRGDCGQQDDPPARSDQILGVVVAKEVKLGKRMVPAKLKGFGGRLLRGAARAQYLAAKALRALRSSRTGSGILGLAVLFLILAVSNSYAQVAVDAATSSDKEFTGTGTLTFATPLPRPAPTCCW